MQPEQASPGLWVSCPVCGHRNADAEPRCDKCGRRLPPLQDRDESSPLGPTTISAFSQATQAEPALPPPLRRQLSARVQEFRVRRLNPTLPFVSAEEEAVESKVVPIRAESRHREARKTGDRPRRLPSVAEQQPDLEFLSPVAPSEPVFIPPVAPFQRRMIAASLDLVLILAAAVVFSLFLKLVAGPVPANRFLLAGGLSAIFLLALLYGGVFLYGTGATPGMKRLSLRLVNFDGKPAPRRQRLWRLAGIIVSAGSFFLGYIWAAFDEESLFWHDRISKTFLTTADEPGSFRSPSPGPPAATLRR